MTDFPGFDARVVVTSFLPELVSSLGSTSHDYVYLLPFYSKPRAGRGWCALPMPRPRRLSGARPVGALLFGSEREYYQAGCKAYLLELLFHVARHFRSRSCCRASWCDSSGEPASCSDLFDHIREHHAERLSVAQAARVAGMRPSQLRKTFKRVAGMSLVRYLNHVRLTRALQLLRESELSIAEIAMETGFADQSYFDRRFRREHGETPSAFRARQGR